MKDCLDFLYNVLMTYNAIFTIEHYLILTLLDKGDLDHVLNVLVEHLEKERKALENMRERLLQCVPGCGGSLGVFEKLVEEGLGEFTNVEFTSFLINRPDYVSGIIRRYMHAHVSAYSSFMRMIEDFVLTKMGEGLY